MATAQVPTTLDTHNPNDADDKTDYSPTVVTASSLSSAPTSDYAWTTHSFVITVTVRMYVTHTDNRYREYLASM